MMLMRRLLLGCSLILLLSQVNNSSVDGQHFSIDKPKRCSRSRVHGKVAYDCFNLQLKSIPTNLGTDVQVLDVSYNRIRELIQSSFAKYTYLEILYLGDNAISYIEDDAFKALTYLQVLDLSLNSIHEIPDSLLSLSSLWKLDFSQNPLSENGVQVAFSSKTVAGNLKWLSLANCHLLKLPPLDAFPLLMILNVSGNAQLSFTSKHLAPACSLATLDLGKAYTQLPYCDCLTLRQWSLQDEIAVWPKGALNCSSRPIPQASQSSLSNSCSEMQMELQSIRAECKSRVAAQVQQERTNRTLITAGAVVASLMIIAILVTIFCVHRRRKRNRRRTENNNSGSIEKPVIDQTQNKLLNFESTSVS